MDKESFDFSSLFGKIAKVKLPNGIVGKVSLVLIVMLIVGIWGSTKINDKLFSSIIIGGILLIVLIILLRLISFANNNPQAALFEGAELLYHEQMHLASKDQGNIPFNPKLQLMGEPINSSDANSIADIPDSEEK